ncbi:MAG: response regulator, partial [Planctomycetes bacterium]|nr:response regulator [Planctomycetota bacterium]
LLHMQRMESIGTLAGGVAHEFNNLLQAIRGYTQFAMADLAAEDSRRRDLEQVLAASERATTLTRQLLTFGRREPLSKRLVDPNQVVADLAKMLRPLIGAHIDLDLSLQSGVGAIHADPSQLHQAILNLCINARDAMPDGGRLVLKTEVVDLTDKFCRRHPGSRVGPHVAVTVSDSGCGMPPEVLGRIYEPFFTTKGTGKGTGLGLAITYSMVQQHEGTIHVSSEPGQGTTFRMYLPVAEAEETEPDAEPCVEHAAGGTEVVLVAEDDPSIRDMIVRVLEGVGYSVLPAADGAEALQCFKQHSETISLVILDSLMPKLTGPESLANMKAIKPELRAILSSGNGISPARIPAIANQAVIFLEKPFDAQTLLRAARTALDDRGLARDAELLTAVQE